MSEKVPLLLYSGVNNLESQLSKLAPVKLARDHHIEDQLSTFTHDKLHDIELKPSNLHPLLVSIKFPILSFYVLFTRH